MANDVEIAIVGTDFEEGMIGAVPSIDHVLDHIFVIVQLKAKWSLVGLATGITLNVQPHGVIFAQNQPVKRCLFVRLSQATLLSDCWLSEKCGFLDSDLFCLSRPRS